MLLLLLCCVLQLFQTANPIQSPKTRKNIKNAKKDAAEPIQAISCTANVDCDSASIPLLSSSPLLSGEHSTEKCSRSCLEDANCGSFTLDVDMNRCRNYGRSKDGENCEKRCKGRCAHCLKTEEAKYEGARKKRIKGSRRAGKSFRINEQNQIRSGESVCKADKICSDDDDSELIAEHSDSLDIGDCSLRCFITEGCNAYVSMWSQGRCRLYSKCGKFDECHRCILCKKNNEHIKRRNKRLREMARQTKKKLKLKQGEVGNAGDLVEDDTVGEIKGVETVVDDDVIKEEEDEDEEEYVEDTFEDESYEEYESDEMRMEEDEEDKEDFEEDAESYEVEDSSISRQQKLPNITDVAIPNSNQNEMLPKKPTTLSEGQNAGRNVSRLNRQKNSVYYEQKLFPAIKTVTNFLSKFVDAYERRRRTVRTRMLRRGDQKDENKNTVFRSLNRNRFLPTNSKSFESDETREALEINDDADDVDNDLFGEDDDLDQENKSVENIVAKAELELMTKAAAKGNNRNSMMFRGFSSKPSFKTGVEDDEKIEPKITALRTLRKIVRRITRRRTTRRTKRLVWTLSNSIASGSICSPKKTVQMKPSLTERFAKNASIPMTLLMSAPKKTSNQPPLPNEVIVPMTDQKAKEKSLKDALVQPLPVQSLILQQLMTRGNRQLENLHRPGFYPTERKAKDSQGKKLIQSGPNQAIAIQDWIAENGLGNSETPNPTDQDEQRRLITQFKRDLASNDANDWTRLPNGMIVPKTSSSSFAYQMPGRRRKRSVDVGDAKSGLHDRMTRDADLIFGASCFKTNEMCVGPKADLDIEATSLHSCHAYCQSHLLCHFYTFRRDLSTCHLFSGCQQVVTCKGCITAIRGCDYKKRNTKGQRYLPQMTHPALFEMKDRAQKMMKDAENKTKTSPEELAKQILKPELNIQAGEVTVVKGSNSQAMIQIRMPLTLFCNHGLMVNSEKTNTKPNNPAIFSLFDESTEESFEDYVFTPQFIEKEGEFTNKVVKGASIPVIKDHSKLLPKPEPKLPDFPGNYPSKTPSGQDSSKKSAVPNVAPAKLPSFTTPEPTKSLEAGNVWTPKWVIQPTTTTNVPKTPEWVVQTETTTKRPKVIFPPKNPFWSHNYMYENPPPLKPYIPPPDLNAWTKPVRKSEPPNSEFEVPKTRKGVDNLEKRVAIEDRISAPAKTPEVSGGRMQPWIDDEEIPKEEVVFAPLPKGDKPEEVVEMQQNSEASEAVKLPPLLQSKSQTTTENPQLAVWGESFQEKVEEEKVEEILPAEVNGGFEEKFHVEQKPERSLQHDPLWLLVSTGAADGDRLTELVDLNRVVLGSPLDVSPPCQFGQYPDPVEGAVIGKVGGKPAVCGGASVGGQGIIHYDRCHRLNGNEWVKASFAQMKNYRTYAGYAMQSPDHWWITGGIATRHNVILDSTEILVRGDRRLTGPAMRLPLAKHCLVTLDPSHSLVVGGLSGGDYTSDDVYLYSYKTDRWQRVANLYQARHSHMCYAEENLNGKVFLAVIGGCDPGGALLSSVEIFEFSISDKSRVLAHKSANPLPHLLCCGQLLQYKGHLIILGGVRETGITDEILVSRHHEGWLLSHVHMRRRRKYFVTQMLGKDLSDFCPANQTFLFRKTNTNRMRMRSPKVVTFSNESSSDTQDDRPEMTEDVNLNNGSSIFEDGSKMDLPTVPSNLGTIQPKFSTDFEPQDVLESSNDDDDDDEGIVELPLEEKSLIKLVEQIEARMADQKDD